MAFKQLDGETAILQQGGVFKQADAVQEIQPTPMSPLVKEHRKRKVRDRGVYASSSRSLRPF